jgi:4-aminobutyrate aminotransferase-like enzyme
MTKDEILLASQDYLFPAVFHYYKEPLVIARAKDQFVYDADGRAYLDFFGGILTISVGHCNDKVNAQIHRQVDTLQHCLDSVRHRAAGGAGEEDRVTHARRPAHQIVLHQQRHGSQ